eukprot:scaffold37717_cov64-Phaeocystis_antarctica.AAC.1
MNGNPLRKWLVAVCVLDGASACTPNPNVMCITLYDPVCGSDGVTYSNTCWAGAACQSWSAGACKFESEFGAIPSPSPEPLTCGCSAELAALKAELKAELE